MNTKDVNSVMLRRAKTMILPEPKKEAGHLSDNVLAALQQRVLRYNFAFSPEMLEAISAFSKKQVKAFADELDEILRDLSGMGPTGHTPFYPNFPEQVALASDTELVFNAMVHYFGHAIGLRVTPVYEEAPRNPISEKLPHATVIGPSKSSALDVAVGIIASPMSISITDRADMITLVDGDFDSFLNLLDPELNKLNRENAAHLLWVVKGLIDPERFKELFLRVNATATDILRYLVLHSFGQASLADNHSIRFRSIARSLRATVMEALSRMGQNSVCEDFLRHENAWKRAVRIIHPGDYKSRYPKVVESFDRLASGSLPKSFAGRVDELMARCDFDGLMNLVVSRPGEFARRLNHILTWVRERYVEDKKLQKEVVVFFSTVVSEVPNTILWQMISFFEARNEDEVRVIHPKGSVTRSQIIPMPEKAYSNKLADKVTNIIVSALMEKYSALDSLGKVWVDPALVKYTVPVGMRSASKSNNAIGRGTRVPLSGKAISRVYVWWTENKNTGRLDVDLSALMLDEDLSPNGFISWQHLRADGILHPGDFTSASNGAAEYIDIDAEKLLKRGVRYVAMVAQVYSGETFANFDCLAGVMGRDNAQSGDIFDARTVERSFEVSADERSLVPMILDLANGEYVWTDVAGTTTGARETVTGKSSALANLVRGAVQKRYVDLYQMFLYHGYARGEVVENREDAETIFEVGPDGFLNVTLDEILSDFL